MLQDNIQFIKGIGPKKAELLKSESGIVTIEDLLYYSPRRYLDRSTFKPIKDTFVNEIVTIGGTIATVSLSGRKKRFLTVEISDGSDSLTGIFFRSIKYFQGIFNPGEYVLFSGKIDFYRTKQIIHPDFDFIDEDSRIKSLNTGRVIPLYRSTEKLKKAGLDSRGFRRIIKTALEDSIDNISDPVDASLLKKYNLAALKDALFSIHFPDTFEDAEAARKRLAFNELFFMQYYLCLSKRYLREESQITKNSVDDSKYTELMNRLPFTLTGDQKKSIGEIRHDLENPFPMNRMLQGDVGSGKTIVAMAASMLAAGRGDQTAVMAPTEVLANQHYGNFIKMMPGSVKIALLKGNMSASQKKTIVDQIANGATDIVIGTHALIQEKVLFKKLGLIIIDEQHRFGVKQRADLREKGENPDLLIMTATPIPRSLSLTLYGDLDISYLMEKPSNRLPVKTMSFPESRLKAVFNSVEKYIAQGRQVYFVFPLIQESEKIDIKSAEAAFVYLKKDVFPHRNIEILHGRMQSDEKESIMERFKNKEIDILVTTTVVEVGIDVPNASIMVIEHAERFGLSQLHQLRGRVGRGEFQSFCALVYPDNTPEENRKRIDIIISTDDGFKIAEEDLKFRGAGSIIGVRQHGHNSGFEFTDTVKDIDLILNARKEAEASVSCIPDINNAFNSIMKEKYSPLLEGIRKKRVLSILS